MVDARHRLRRAVLESSGAGPELIESLLAFGEQPCRRDGEPPPVCPLDDEPQVEAWRQYAREARQVGVVAALQQHLVQLRFPIRSGISREAAYLDATRRGRVEAAAPFAPGPAWRRPDTIHLDVVPAIAGHVPIVTASDRADFETIVRALSGRNEPMPVPPAMGACLVKGLNDWSRVAAYRASWERDHPERDWASGFADLVPRKALYQDRVIVLSTGPYSAVAAADAGLSSDAWLDRSLVIRREHELTHYFVHRVFDVMRSHPFDEIVADFIGLGRAFGGYDPRLALTCLGLEAFPAYRAGGRLEVYTRDASLPPGGDAVVRALVHRAVIGLGTWSAAWPRDRWADLGFVGRLTFALHQLSLEELAAPALPDVASAR